MNPPRASVPVPCGLDAPPTPRPRVRRRRVLPGDGDGRSPAAGAVLRHLERGVGERDRADPRLPQPRLLARRARAPTSTRTSGRSASWCCSRGHDRDPAVRHAAPVQRRGERLRRGLGGRVHRLVRRHAADVRAAGDGARRGRAVGDPARGHRHQRGRRRRRTAVRAVDARLDRRHLPARAVPDPGDRHAPHPAAGRARAGAGGAARPAAPGGAGAGLCWPRCC